MQNARTAMADFNITAMELGKITLPAINGGLKDFKAMLETIRSVLPAATKPGAGAKIGTRALEGAFAGGLWGAFGGPGGALGARSGVASSAVRSVSPSNTSTANRNQRTGHSQPA